MISLRQVFGFLMTVTFLMLLAVGVTSVLGAPNSQTVNTLTLPLSPPMQIATLNPVEAVTKNIEGKAQEVIGNLTSDPQNQRMGKAKQVQSQNRTVEAAASQARNAAAEMKDKMQIKEQAKAMTKGLKKSIKAAKG